MAGSALVLACIAWAALARAYAPSGNTSADRFDAIIVLGGGVNRDGNPTPSTLARVTEAVHEYERGVAPRLILTGHDDFKGLNEARTMARIAQAQGIPAQNLVVEPFASNTIQNACFSARIMREHGWHSAEVVSSATHLPRAELIFSTTPIQWRGHVAPSLEPESGFAARAVAADEVLHTVYYLVFSRWAERCSP
ncbi:MAG: YdcF family protein [Terracidiphilus sp.]